MKHLWTLFKQNFDQNLAEVIVWDVVKIVIFFIIAQIIIRLANRIISRLLRLQRVKLDKRRKDTLESLFANVVRYTVYFFLLVEILATFKINIGALLAGAGVVGLAVGFGAQSLIKDILTGLFILFEDQYGVGDIVQINGFMGTIISVGVRLTYVKAWTGEVEIIPNGQITTVRNYSRTTSTAVVDVGVSYGTNLKQAMDVIERVMNEIRTEEENVIGEVNVLGVQSLGASDVVLRATVECVSMTHYGIQRKAQQRIKEAFDEHGIEIPFPQQTVWLHQES